MSVKSRSSMLALCEIYYFKFSQFNTVNMPRYEPPLESEPLLQQPPVPNTRILPRTTIDQTQPARYQQLNMDAPTPITPQRQYRPSPFRCAQIFDCFDSSILSNWLPTRAMITGYSSGIIFSLGWWIFIDGCVYNSTNYDPSSNMNSLSFEDWVPRRKV